MGGIPRRCFARLANSAMKLLFIILALVSSQAFAGSLALQRPSTVGGSPGAYVTKPGVAITGASFNSGFTTSVAGRAVTVPASFRLASNAAQFAASAVRLNPTALLTSAVALWLLNKGLQYIDGQWVDVNDVAQSEPIYSYYTIVRSGRTASTAYDVCLLEANSIGWQVRSASSTVCAIGPSYQPSYSDSLEVAHGSIVSCPVGTTLNGTMCVGRASQATQADWDAVSTSPIPDNAANELTQNIPLPLQNPEFQPSPIDVPISDPVTDPVTGKRLQDVARITPQPTTPEVADLQVTQREVDSNGDPVTDPQGQPLPPTDKPDPCAENPDRIGCMDKGHTDEEQLQEQNLGQSITPVSVGGGGSCPADKTISYLGKPIVFSFQPICQGAQWMQPLVLSIAWLIAAYILIGAIREG